MTLRVAINGFGRIGRMILRAIAENQRDDLQIVAINDLGSPEHNAHLFQYDSVHGRFAGKVSLDGDYLNVGASSIKMISEPHPEKLPWRTLNVDIVFECSGRFTERQHAQAHITAGARKVIISAPATDPDLTVVYGVNHTHLTPQHEIISCGSCTTNCLAPVADILHRHIGIQYGYMTTIHAYTGDQRLVDTQHSDLRRARAAALSMIPASTGAARALGLVLPELQGRLDGAAFRVPTANVSVVDFKFTPLRPTSIQEINDLMRTESMGEMGAVLSVNDQPLVSTDFNHMPYSSNFDLTLTQVIDGQFCRVVSWYDNEWGFANRMSDVAVYWHRLSA